MKIQFPYKIARTLKQVRELVSYCKKTGYASIDFETTSLKYYEPSENATILGVSFQPGSAWIVPLYHFQSPLRGKEKEALAILNDGIFQDDSIVKVSWNAKYEYKWLKRYGINLQNSKSFFDSMLAKYLLDEERPHGLKENTDRWLPKYSGYALPGSNSEKFNWSKVPLEELSHYCAIDASNSLMFFLFYEQKLIKKGFYRLYINLINPLVKVLGDMEYQGMIIDKPYLSNLIEEYSSLIQSTKDGVFQSKPIIRFTKLRIKERLEKFRIKLEDEKQTFEVGSRPYVLRDNLLRNITNGSFQPSNKEQRAIYEDLNLGSPKQLIDFLYNAKYGLKLPITELTESGSPSTDEATLLNLKDKDKTGFIESLLKYRELMKLDSTYISGMWNHLSSKGRIHSSYKINGTVTGRLSSVEPNMQNIPRVTTNPKIKPMFIPPPGYLWVEYDYSQAELRVVAEQANEKKMIEWFKSGHNIHVAVAVEAERVNTGKDITYEQIYPITKDESHPEHIYWTKRKKRAKTINFGILYEQSDPKLAETMKCSVEEASQFKKEWLKTFPAIARWINRQHKLVKEQGYIENIWGFRRRLPKIYSHKYGEMLEAQRQSVNAPIQGSASFYTLFSLIQLWYAYLSKRLMLDFYPVYTVHDSIGLWLTPKQLEYNHPIISTMMSNPDTEPYFGFRLKKVPMKASCEVGLNWGSMSDYSPKIDYTKLLNP